MSTGLSNLVVVLTWFCGAVLVQPASCPSAEPTNDAPGLPDGQMAHEKLKTPALNEALGRCLAGVSSAREEQRRSDSKIRANRRPHFQGGWAAYIEFSEGGHYGAYSIRFFGDTEQIVSFRKYVYSDSKHQNELHDLGFEIHYSDDGKLDTYRQRSGKTILKLYPNGRLKEFAADLDDGSRGLASWDRDGKVQSERINHAKQKSDSDKEKKNLKLGG